MVSTATLSSEPPSNVDWVMRTGTAVSSAVRRGLSKAGWLPGTEEIACASGA